MKNGLGNLAACDIRLLAAIGQEPAQAQQKS
jgi:hypothetical protein